ncbi:MAG: FHA domain-containing protein [Oscillospiraceae bacterium]|jgi:hypothetical protein|nr:FHA domain-containing protein [Oscillospiraceae bacterium]
MIYPIQAKSDILTGAALVVRIPEAEVDKMALYTIEADTPSFILPFRYQTIDGDVEFTYLIGTRNNIKYSYGSRNSKEYAALWRNVLNPLLECNDWFMRSLSFVLQTEYLYYDKNSGMVSYVYIPSVRECSDENSLKQMVTELAEKCPADNPELEISALRAIMQGFNPKEFLQMLKSYPNSDGASLTSAPERGGGNSARRIDKPQEASSFNAPSLPRESVSKQASKKESASAQYPYVSGAEDDIIINLHGWKEDKKKKPDKVKPKTGSLFGGKADKKAAPTDAAEQPKSQARRIFGKKKTGTHAVIAEDAEASRQSAYGRNGVNEAVYTDANSNIDVNDEDTQFEDGDVTQLEGSSAKLRLFGSAALPSEIAVGENLDRPFIIGRFDVSVGKKQADFEFDKSTKAVSRRHASIERAGNGYVIIDLSSSAGTFVNGQKLTPNVPCELTFGTRVSFGTSGADYVFEG